MDTKEDFLKYRYQLQSTAYKPQDDSSTICEKFITNNSTHNRSSSFSKSSKVTMESKSDLPTAKKNLSLSQIILLNSVVCGIEVCACAGFTYIPPMLLKAGYTEENMSIILGMGPLIGFFLVPLIGRASDHCKSPYGRRRPFIIGLSVFLLLSLVLIPYGDLLCYRILGMTSVGKTAALTLLTISVVMLDFTSQACLTPCEALLSDASKGTNQKERVFMIYSQMVSLGGFLGYLITALDWNGSGVGNFFGGQERTVFTLLIVVFLFLLSGTVLVAQEQPLTSLDHDIGDHDVSAVTTTTLPAGQVNSGTLESGYESSDEDEDSHDSSSLLSPRRSVKSARSKTTKRIRNPLTGFGLLILSCLTCFSRIRLLTIISNTAKVIFMSAFNRLPNSLRKIFDVPLVLKNLALANFCSWTALMGFNLFFTDFMGQSVYQGNPNAPENSFLRNRYDEGVRMGSWGLLLHCITSTTYAFFIERLVEKHGTRKTYLVGMVIFTVSMFGMVLNKNVIFVSCMAALTGFTYATVTTIPFILITKYHSCKEVFFFDAQQSSSKSADGDVTTRGIATDMGTLDSAYFLAQVVLSAMMGYIVHMTGTVTSYMVTSGVMGVLSCIFIQRIITSKKDINQCIHSRNMQAAPLRHVNAAV